MIWRRRRKIIVHGSPCFWHCIFALVGDPESHYWSVAQKQPHSLKTEKRVLQFTIWKCLARWLPLWCRLAAASRRAPALLAQQGSSRGLPGQVKRPHDLRWLDRWAAEVAAACIQIKQSPYHPCLVFDRACIHQPYIWWFLRSLRTGLAERRMPQSHRQIHWPDLTWIGSRSVRASCEFSGDAARALAFCRALLGTGNHLHSGIFGLWKG